MPTLDGKRADSFCARVPAQRCWLFACRFRCGPTESAYPYTRTCQFIRYVPSVPRLHIYGDFSTYTEKVLCRVAGTSPTRHALTLHLAKRDEELRLRLHDKQRG